MAPNFKPIGNYIVVSSRHSNVGYLEMHSLPKLDVSNMDNFGAGAVFPGNPRL